MHFGTWKESFMSKQYWKEFDEEQFCAYVELMQDFQVYLEHQQTLSLLEKELGKFHKVTCDFRTKIKNEASKRHEVASVAYRTTGAFDIVISNV